MMSKQLEHSEQNPGIAYQTKVDSSSEILTQKSFSLLEERLRIELTQHKIGEIVIRKEIVTQLVQVQVPIRREKLMIEQVSPAYKLLAEIDLGQTTTADLAIPSDLTSIDNHQQFMAVDSDDRSQRLSQQSPPRIVYGTTNSLTAASSLLGEIANLPTQDCGTIRIEIALKDPKHHDVYQALVDRYFRS